MHPRERAVAFVVVRLSSKRLAAKHLRRIGDRTLLDWVVGRLAESTELDGVVLATAAEPANLPLRRYAEKRGIECFWYEGDVDHVTTRLRRAAEHANADICVLVSADCPLLSAPTIDFLVRELRAARGMDVVGVLEDGLQHGSQRRAMLEGCQVARRKAWQLADDLSDTPELKRHQFPVMARREELFRVLATSLPEWLYGPRRRLSVDTWADLEFMTALHDRLAARGEPFELPRALALLAAEPELAEINAHVHQRAADEVERHALFAVDAGASADRRHLARSLELALQLVERKGMAVTFLVDGEAALAELAERGLGAVWGALGRVAAAPPRGVAVEPVAAHLAQCDLIVLDLADDAHLEPGWRAALSAGTAAALCDRAGDWTDEADLVLDASGIVRREVRRAARTATKDVDVLVRLASPERREAVQRFAARHGLRIDCGGAARADGSAGASSATSAHGWGSARGNEEAHSDDGTSAEASERDFPARLARARVLLSDCGASVRDALVAGTHPVLWTEDASAQAWFERVGIAPAIVERESDLFLLHGLVSAGGEPCVRPHDATGAIVERLWRRVERLPTAERAPVKAPRARTRR